MTSAKICGDEENSVLKRNVKELEEQGGNRSESKDMHPFPVSLPDVTGIPLKEQKEDDSKNVYLYLLEQEKQEGRMSFLRKLLCNSWSSSLSVESVSPVSSTTFPLPSVEGDISLSRPGRERKVWTQHVWL